MKIPQGQVDTSPEEDFRFKVDYMMRDLLQRGCWKSTIAPPVFRLAWSIGWQLVPPLFANTWTLALFMGGVWGMITGALMWLAVWRTWGVDLTTAVEFVSSTGAIFGFPTAFFYRFRARQLRLPSWEMYPHARNTEVISV